MNDDAIRERHGMACSVAKNQARSFVVVWEGDESIFLDSNFDVRELTQWQARYLASKLYRLARRIRSRAQEQQP